VTTNIKLNSFYELDQGSFAGSRVIVTLIKNNVVHFTIVSGQMVGAKKSMDIELFSNSIKNTAKKSKQRRR